MRTEIYYYSGTGNSLHVAREISQRVPGSELIPIVSLLRNEKISISGDRIGFICPVYVNSIPIQVQKFLKKAEFGHEDSIFLVVTHGGFTNLNLPRRVMERILKSKGKELDAYYHLKMTNNSATGIMPTFIPGVKDWAEWIKPERVMELEKKIQEDLDKMGKKIANNVRNLPHGKDGLGTRLFDRFLKTFPENPKRRISFFSDDTCVGCGICERVCLSGKIELVNGKPSWQKDIDCYHCYACYNFCPEQAILVKNYKKKDGRYHHPDITAEDISSQK